MGKTKNIIGGLAFLTATAGSLNAAEIKDSQNDMKKPMTEQKITKDDNSVRRDINFYFYKLGISKENMGQISYTDNVIRNTYTNEEGKEVSQYFTKIGNWAAVYETSGKTYTIKAHQKDQTIEYTREDLGDISGNLFEKRGETIYKGPFSGNIGGNLHTYSEAYINIDISEFLNAAEEVYEKEIKEFDKSNYKNLNNSDEKIKTTSMMLYNLQNSRE